MCRNLTSAVPQTTHGNVIDVQRIMKYLSIWNHTDEIGNILAVKDGNRCGYIEVKEDVNARDTLRCIFRIGLT